MPNVLDSPFLLVCEGASDEAFFQQLMRTRNIRNFQTAYPNTPEQISGGRSGFGDLLGGLLLKPDFPNLRAILIATDIDDNQARSLRSIREEIAKAEGYGIPGNFLEIATAENRPAILILPIPWIGQLGNLETLCFPAAADKWPDLATCLESYFQCSDAPRWSISRQSKMKLRCMISATCKTDPNTSLVHLWSRRRAEFHIPLEHQCFNQLAEFLANFSTA